jgi:hypothetical protein
MAGTFLGTLLLIAFSCIVSCVESFIILHHHAATPSVLSLSRRQHPQLSMTFYNDFDDMEEDFDEEDDDYEELDDSAVANFRSRMGNMFDGASTEMAESAEGSINFDDLMSFVRKKEQGSKDFANPSSAIEVGVVLIANPAKFCTDFGNTSPSATLLSKFGLTLPPPADLGPDRRADLLPVLCLLEKHPLRGSHAVLLNRRTGYLLGDLEQPSPEDGTPTAPKLGAFMIQPLWFGGTSAGGTEESSSQSSGLDMLHQCPTVKGAKQLTPDGLYWGGDPAQAQDAMSDASLERVFTGFDFKFFVQSTRWMPLQLEKEIRDGVWFVASVNKEVLFKPRDRMGTRRAKPLWTEIMELLGGEYLDIRNKLYVDDQ